MSNGGKAHWQTLTGEERETPLSQPTKLPVPPEPFPGFGKSRKAAARDIREATKRMQVAEQRLVTHKFSKWMYTTGTRPRYTVGSKEWQAWVAAGRRGRFIGAEEIPAKEKWQAEQEEFLLERQEAVLSLARASWFSDFYATVPSLVEVGAITSLGEYLELMKSDPSEFLSPEDLDAARGTLIRLGVGKKVTSREDAPDWLKVTPEEEEAAREFLKAERPLAAPVSIHSLTTAELLKSLAATPRMELPEGMSDKELLAIMSVLDIPPEEALRAVDYTELVKPFSDAISEREERIKAVLAGEEEWKMPELGFWQRAMFTVLSPMQTAADIIRPYLEKVSYPIAGFVAYTVSRMLSGTQDIEDKYDKMKAMGYSPWEAMSEAWQEWELPWFLKLGLEILTDPITYIPGLLFSVPGRVLSRIPTAGTRLLGAQLLNLNRGMWAVLDIPFDAAKTLWAAIPKTFAQTTKFELDTFRDLLTAAATKQSGKIINMLTPDDLTKTLERAVRDFADTPMKQGDVFVDLGAELLKHAPLGPDDVKIWSRSLGGKLEEVTPAILESVEDVLGDVIMRIGSPAENAKRIAIALAIEDSPATIGKIIKDIGVLTSKYTTRVAKAIEIGKTSKIAPVLRMTEYLVSGQKKIITAVERSEYAKGKALSGMVLGLMNKVDKIERGVFRTTLDRWLIRPFAEAYLGSVAYPIWNVFEGVFVSVMEGVVPRMVKQEAFQRLFLGIRGVDSRVAQWSASDVVGMLGTMPGREGAISMLPGKVPAKVVGLKTPKWIAGKDWFEWTGRKWIELSDVWGTALRANFLMRKMAGYLAEYSYSVAGHDINAAFKKLMGKPPAVSKKSLGLTSHELKQEMFARLSSGLKSEVLGMKELLSNSPLMQGEALKILRQATELSPQAKTLGEQMIARGEAFRTVDDVMSFCKTLADQSAADLKAFPTQVPDSFRFMADQIERQSISTPDDLMQIFQHYEVMADSASRAPMRLLSQVFEEADELKRLGKFKQLEELWRTSRADVDNITSSINESLSRVRAVVQGKSGLLKDKEQLALNILLERNTARITLQEQWLRFDGRLLDDFWALPKALRTAEEHTALRAYRWDNILKYKGEDAVLGAGDFLERQSYAKLYYSLPAPKLFHVDASARALSADDCAKAMGANVDALTTGLMESMTFQDKAYFIQMIKQAADAHPTYFKGFTEDKIGQVYDNIVRGLRMAPEMDIATQKILQQVEGVKQRMIALRMNKSLSPTEEKALHGWIDDVAGGMDNVVGKKGMVTTAQWEDIRQKASERAHKEYYKAFADYTNENIIDAMGKTIYPFWCTPEHVTALTKNGWKHYSQLQVGEDVLTVNPKTLITEWQPIQEIASFDYDDDLTVIPAKGKDIEFTPDHRWLVVDKLTGRNVKTKRGFELVEGYDAIPRALPHAFPNESLLSPRDAAILGWVVTDGTIADYIVVIYQSEAKHFDEIVRLTGYVNGTGDLVDGNVRQDKRDESNWIIRLSREDRYMIMSTLDQYSLPEVVAMLSKEAAEAMWDAMFKAEGNTYECYTGSLQRSFKQNPGTVMQAFQLLSVLVGKAITANSHRVNILDNRKPYLAKEVRRVRTKHYKGKIWCPVTANGTWFANFNGCVLPTGNTYHMYRWFFLPRTFLRKPGAMAAWGKYYEYSDYGYHHIPGTDLEFNPAVGSAFGATFSLARHDFKSYYENLGFLGEVLDFTQRRGFFPGIHVTAPIALTSIFSDRPPELGEVLPPLHRVGLNLLVTSKVPGVADAATWLKDRVFHENFHDYYTSTIVSSKQSEAGGKLIDGQVGVDLWFKRQRGEKLTEEEQKLWDEAYDEAAWYAILRSEFPEFRMRAEEMLEAHKQVTALIEAQTGMDEDFQNNLWKHNLRPTDVMGGVPLDLQMALDQMWQWRIYFGRGAVLMPPEYSDLYALTNKYYDKVESLQLNRLGLQLDTNRGFLHPTSALHFSGREWRREYANNWSAYTSGVETLETDPEFADAVDAMTYEGQVRLAKELGFTPPPVDPMREAIRLYFDTELLKKTDPYTGEEDWDYLRFWLEREACRMALPEEQRADFDTYIRRYSTPMEILFKNVSNDYLRGYRAVSRIVLEEFTDEEKALIAEYYADTTTRERQLEIKEVINQPSGRKLISYWDSRRTDVRAALREASPKLDFWLYVFGYITAPKTDEAKAMIDAWEKDKSSIVLGITESPLLETVKERAEARKEEKELK